MRNVSVNERKHITSAFELAYFIIPDKGIALSVAEQSCCLLDVMLGKQERTRRAYKQLLGFIKWEEKSRPLRTRIRLDHEQMLQWIVYYQSDSWERATEYVGSHYPPGIEDMVVRYIKHLVRITLNRNSFYVALGITRLLYDYTTHEVRFMYDVLTASDSARMKDPSYLRKQKAVLMDEIILRFDGLLREDRGAHGEKRFEPQRATERLIHLVRECLSRFAPWNTICVLEGGFDPTAIPELYFSGTGSADEDRVEMNRIHTILHPECFSRLVNGLSQFIQRLPLESPDKGCNYDAPDERLAVPLFRKIDNAGPLDDRFTPPKLEPDDYLRLQRTREAIRRRRKALQPRQLRIHVDDIEVASFDPIRTARARLDIAPNAGIIEVRSDDTDGELMLAALIVYCDHISAGEPFKDWAVLEGGQKITIQLKPTRNGSGSLESVSVEVSYAETGFPRAILWHARRGWHSLGERAKDDRSGKPVVRPAFPVLWNVGAIVAIIVALLVMIWFQVRSPHPTAPPAPQAETPAPPEIPVPPQTPPDIPPARPPAQEPFDRLIADIRWSRNPEAAREAIRLEPTRGEIAKVELPRNQREILVALPQADSDNHAFVRYRVTLLEAEKPVWRQTLQPPKNTARFARVLNLIFSAQLRGKAESIVLQFEGLAQADWQPLGTLTVEFTSR